MNFYRHLLGATSGRCIVFCTVRVADVVEVSFQRDKNQKKWQTLFNKISSKHFDFVLVDNDMNILCAIELNDKSHERKERQERDAFLRKVMKSADIPLLEIKAARKYNIVELRQRIDQLVPTLIASNSPVLAPAEAISETKPKKSKPFVGKGYLQNTDDDAIEVLKENSEFPPTPQTSEVLPITAPERERKTLSDIQLEMERPTGKTPFEIAIEKSEKYLKQENKQLPGDDSGGDFIQTEPVVQKSTSYQTRDMRLGRE